MKVRVDVEGVDDVLASLRKLEGGGLEAARGVFAELAPGVVARAKALTPDDPETADSLLRDSVRSLKARITKGRGGEKRVEVTFVAGGSKTAPLAPGRVNVVALVQHEDLTLKHARGQAKFLERPVLAATAGIPAALEAALDKVAAEVSA